MSLEIKIRTNAETPQDTKMARNFGAEVLVCAELNICFLTMKEFYQLDK